MYVYSDMCMCVHTQTYISYIESSIQLTMILKNTWMKETKGKHSSLSLF